jgi:hypothetical protein
VASYRFDECSGKIANDTHIWVNGTYGSALSFDGVNDYVRVNNIPVDTSPGANNTVMFWMYWNGINNQMPISWTTNYDLYIVGLFGFNTYNSDIWGISTSGLSNRWVHVTAIFYNGYANKSRLFIDGVEQTLSQSETAGSKIVSNSFNIGIGSNSNDYSFNGIIDEIKIWNRTLSASEILNCYQTGC